MPPAKGMTSKEHGEIAREKILKAIIEYIEEHGYPPMQKEIIDITGMTQGEVSRQLHVMLAIGMIETDEEYRISNRAIRVPGYDPKTIKNKAIKKCLSILYKNAGKFISTNLYYEVYEEISDLLEGCEE